jgi:multidrug resistance efflux pump
VLGYQAQQAQAVANSAQAGRDLADTVVEELAGFEPFDEWVLVGTYDVGHLPVDIPLPADPDNGEYRWRRYRIVVRGDTVELWYLAAIRLPNDALPAAQYEQATATYQSWQAWTGLAQAQAARQGTAAYLEQLAAQKASPLALEAQANAAEAQYKVAGAAVAVARSQVEGLKMGATAEQIAAAEAQVEMARAALDALRSQRQRFTLKAPLSGLVLARPAHPGEMATPGVPLLTLADLSNLTLTVYVPEGELGRIRLGQVASVSVDAYPGRTFTGTLTYVGDQAEFAPRNVQTREERVNLVFAVKIQLSNADQALKPGMPADAVLSEQ